MRRPRILIGVVANGNGHLSRVSELMAALRGRADIDVLVSGDHRGARYEFEVKYRHRGIVLAKAAHGLSITRSLAHSSPIGDILAVINNLPVGAYDAVLSDGEPLTAHACARQDKTCIGVSHLAAFLSPKTPRPAVRDPFAELFLKHQAPCTIPLAFHFEPYDSFVHTPLIARAVREASPQTRGHYTVYLPFVEPAALIGALSAVDVAWDVFSPFHRSPETLRLGNVRMRPPCRAHFLESLISADGLLAGAGFQAPAEALHLGKKLIVVPARGHYEQACNAEALRRLGVSVINTLETAALETWIDRDFRQQRRYGDNLPWLVEHILAIAERGPVSALTCACHRRVRPTTTGRGSSNARV